MGLCVDADETPHSIDFEVRRASVRFWVHDNDNNPGREMIEIHKLDLIKLKGLLNDEKWAKRLTEIT